MDLMTRLAKAHKEHPTMTDKEFAKMMDDLLHLSNIIATSGYLIRTINKAA